ncbi:MAG: SDR family oxidoreductase, partial [Candidatus Dormibacteria bacterium]
MEVAGQVAVVTGGASGIGRALCKTLAAERATGVVVADLDLERAEAVAAEVGGLAVQADVTVEQEVQSLVQRAIAVFGRIDLYCSNAGVAFGGGPEAPDHAWQQSFQVHVLAHVYAARAVLPGMLRQGAGYFLGTISAAGLLNHVGAAPYAATKAAGLSFLEWMT